MSTHRIPVAARSSLNVLGTVVLLLCSALPGVASEFSGEPIWIADTDWPAAHIELAHLNGDLILDIIAGEHNSTYYGEIGHVFAFDGATGDTLWMYQVDDGVRAMTIGDINNDGVQDVIAGTSYHSSNTPDGRVHAIDGATGTQLWAFPTANSSQSVCVCDLNGDEYLDVAVAGFSDFVFGIDGATGLELWRKELGSMWTNAVDAADVTGDDIDDIAFAHEYLANFNNYMGVIDGTDGSFVWSLTVTSVVLDAMLEDIDDDGTIEAIFTLIDGADQGYVQVRNGASGALEWQYDFGTINHTNGQINLHTYDIDGDTDLDLVISNYLGWRRVIAFDGTVNTPMYISDSLDSYPYDVGFGDITGDESLDIACAAWDRVIVISAVDGAQIWEYVVDGRIYEVDVADFDDDKVFDVAAGGTAEAVGTPPNPGKSVWTLRSAESPVWWEYHFGEYGNGMAIGDINGDEFMDVLAVASLDDWVWAIDGQTGLPLWNWVGTENLYAVTTGDFNFDGQIDVAVAGNDDRVTALNGADGSFMWEFTDPTDQIYRKCLAATDVNLDNAVDVIVGTDNGIIYALDGLSGTKADIIWATPYTGGDCEEVEIADMNGIPPLDVVAIVGSQMVVLNGSDGTELWTYSTGTSGAKSCEVLDANDDGVPDVAIGVSGASGSLIMVDGVSHTALWVETPFSAIYEYGLSHARCNEDKADDLIAAAGNAAYAFDGPTGTELWNYPVGDDVNAVLGADVNGDGQPDVLMGSDDRIFRAVDGLTGELFFEYSTAGDVMDVAVGDVSGDGALNMACVTFGSDGVLYTFNSLYSASCCVGMTGNIDADPLEQINIADLVYLVLFMFQDGPEPPCMLEADIDGNGTLVPDIADLVYLATYMFQEGPEPSACD